MRCPRCDALLPADAPEGFCHACAATSADPPSGPDPSRPTNVLAAPSSLPAPAELEGLFPQLEILELVGQGGMGCVYKARQRGLDRIVALKILPHRSGGGASAERFAREARALARLSHPSIVTIHDSGEAEGLYYFVMEYVDGVNLRQLMQSSQGLLEPAEALRIVGSMCDALEYAHEEGIVHRDIKPENILLDRRGRVKVADFGLAKLLRADGPGRSDPTLTSPVQLMGTPHYMAPEQTEAPPSVDHRADIYSLGVVFYEMLTGELPLGRFPLPSELGRGDVRLDRIVERTLAKDPERRFQRASEIRAALESIGAAPPAAAPPPQDPAAAADCIDLAAAARRLRGPANLLLVAAALSLGIYVPAAIISFFQWVFGGESGAMLRLSGFMAGCACSWIAILGAGRMRSLAGRPLAITACVLSMVPGATLCWIPLGLPAGIWGLAALLSPEVAAAFDLAASQRQIAASRAAQAGG